MPALPFTQPDGLSHTRLPESSTNLDTHPQEARDFTQELMNRNVALMLFNGEMNTRANILNMLTKLEDKYQVRG